MPLQLAPAPVASTVQETDALVIGAGPVGLFQVFELGLLGLSAQVVDALPYPGGQCIELYADKPIYDIPALPVCTGRELVDRLLTQIRPFNAPMHLGQQVSTICRLDNGHFAVETSTGTQLHAKTIFVAAGVGAFQPRTLTLEGIDRFVGTQVFYAPPAKELLAGKAVLVLGDGESALQQAIALAEQTIHAPGSVTLLHRRHAFKAAPETVHRLDALCQANALRFVAAQPTGCMENNGKLSGLQVTDSEGSSQALAADIVLPLLGLSPKLGPVTQWGLEIDRKQIRVNTEDFSTSEPGIYAVGDINTYAGKRKLILCGFHECTLAAFGAAARLSPGQPVHLQYTTTSPRLHSILGVASSQINAQA